MGFGPASPSTIDTYYFSISHPLKVVGSQGGAKSPTAVEKDLLVWVRNDGFDVPFDNAFAQMNGSGNVSGRKFAVFAYIHQGHVFTLIHTCFKFVDRAFMNAGFRFISDR